MRKFDVIVVGAGTAGCLTAKTVAKADLEVCLIERKKREDVGEKVCGDAVGRHHFDNLGLDYPSGEELERKMVGAKIYSPDMETVYDIKGEGLDGFIVDRKIFGQRLLRDAIDAGSTFLKSTQVLEPIIENNNVTGVLVRDLKTGRKATLRSQVVVDASGYSAVIRKALPPEIGVDTDVEKKDVMICYREIRELKEDAEMDFCEIYLDQTVSPDGYYWVFPEGGRKVNVGIGVAMCKGFPNPKTQLYNHVLSQPLFKDSRILGGGTWYDPARRPIDCMTGNGVAIVGDAACQVNPIHGGGMGPSMMGGALAGKTIVEAIEEGDVSRKGLWLYNPRYMQVYGAKQAGLDVFRLLLQQKLSNEDLNYGMKYKLITQEDVLKTCMGEDVRLNITDVTIRIFRGLRKLSLLRELRHAANLLKKVKALYRNYPTAPQGFDEWKKRAQDLIIEAGG